jgi:hypothetical protein
MFGFWLEMVSLGMKKYDGFANLQHHQHSVCLLESERKSCELI